MEINIPEGFIVQLPKNTSFDIYAGNAAYTYETTRLGNKIMVKIRVAIKKIEFPAEVYNDLKQLFTELNEKIQEDIIIKPLLSSSMNN
jgi:hypothetical protein